MFWTVIMIKIHFSLKFKTDFYDERSKMIIQSEFIHMIFFYLLQPQSTKLQMKKKKKKAKKLVLPFLPFFSLFFTVCRLI